MSGLSKIRARPFMIDRKFSSYRVAELKVCLYKKVINNGSVAALKIAID